MFLRVDQTTSTPENKTKRLARTKQSESCFLVGLQPHRRRQCTSLTQLAVLPATTSLASLESYSLNRNIGNENKNKKNKYKISKYQNYKHSEKVRNTNGQKKWERSQHKARSLKDCTRLRNVRKTKDWNTDTTTTTTAQTGVSLILRNTDAKKKQMTQHYAARTSFSVTECFKLHQVLEDLVLHFRLSACS